MSIPHVFNETSAWLLRGVDLQAGENRAAVNNTKHFEIPLPRECKVFGTEGLNYKRETW